MLKTSEGYLMINGTLRKANKKNTEHLHINTRKNYAKIKQFTEKTKLKPAFRKLSQKKYDKKSLHDYVKPRFGSIRKNKVMDTRLYSACIKMSRAGKSYTFGFKG